MKRGRKLLTMGLSAALALSLGLPGFAAPANAGSYVDVPADAWYAGAVDYVRENGLMSGTSATTFSPDGTMSRATLATVLYRAAGEPEVMVEDSFPDTDAGEWYSNAVAWCAEHEYINGYDDGRIGTNDPVTREQFTAILWRYAGRPEAGKAADFADEASISGYAQTAVDWALFNGILNGRENNLFAPGDSATRAEAATILRNFMTLTTPMLPAW